MPLYSVYVLRQNFPRELRYRSAVCRLELARGDSDGEWVLRWDKRATEVVREVPI